MIDSEQTAAAQNHAADTIQAIRLLLGEIEAKFCDLAEIGVVTGRTCVDAAAHTRWLDEKVAGLQVLEVRP